MASVASANLSLLVSRTAWREAVGDALRLYVGRGRRYSVKELSNGTGVPDRVIECAMCDPEAEDFRPMPGECLASIDKFLGEGFTTERLRLSGLGAYALPDEELPHPTELVRECANDTAEVAEMAAEEVEFGADDERALRALGHRLVERGMTLVAFLGRHTRRRRAA